MYKYKCEKYEQKYNKLLYDYAKDKPLINSINKIKNNLSIDNIPVYEYRQIPNILKYESSKHFLSTNCHLGQRKLLLTEIEFYAKCIDNKLESQVVIYAGSASCEHLPVILDMFPNLKFILIDPNYHSIDKYPFKYIYQNTQSIDSHNLKSFKRQLRYTNIKNTNQKTNRLSHLLKTTKLLQNVEFLNSTEKYDVLNFTENVNKMNEIKENFYNNNYKKLIKEIMDGDERVFIIQDYMTKDLTKKLKQSLDTYDDTKLKMYFLTDIRTNFFGSAPIDLDILWNYALQIIFLKILNPEYSMLKFRPPYFADIDSDIINKFKLFYSCKQNNDNYTFNMMKDDLVYVKNNYNLDMFNNYLNKKFEYFDNNFIYIQPWAPIRSSECRLFVSKKNINKPYINYNQKEWDNKFYYMSLYRQYAYHSIFYDILKNKYNMHYNMHYDGCYDCARELIILGNYLQNKSDNITWEIDLQAIKNTLSDDKNIKILSKLYKLINKYTYFDLSHTNYKCKYHGYIKKVPHNIKLYYKISHKIHSLNLPL